jgi:N-acetylmuramoyl-L-alanine amidase
MKKTEQNVFQHLRFVLFVLTIGFITQLLCQGTYAGGVTPIRLVVIDAGHGGKDPGAIGKRTQEKFVTLSVARKLGDLITSSMPGVRVIYTRDKDEFIELHERAAIANRNKADLFISIHCNANKNKSLRGAETYVMGLHRSEANLEVAKFENASILMEADYDHIYEGFDPNSDESYITFSLFQNSNLDMSTQLAAQVQEQMEDRVGLNDRGVRQAGFLVLYRTTMPSILVEIGYLSNPAEEDFLISSKGQDYIVSAIVKALKAYQLVETAIEPREKTTIVKADSSPVITDVKKAPAGSAIKPKSEKPAAPKKDQGIFFTVQIATSPTDIGTGNARFKGIKDVGMYQQNGLFKYTAGKSKDYQEALKLLSELKKRGFRDAFIIAFRDGERITADKARALLGQ